MNAYLQLDHIDKSFARGKSENDVLKAVTFSIDKGEFVSIIGHSGCGKSTLLNIVAGLTAPTTGGVILEGREVNAPGPDRAVVFQNHSLLPWLTVYGNVRLAVDWIKSVEVVDPYRLRIHANAPTPAAFEYLSGNTPIYPAGHWDNAPVVTIGGGKTRHDWGAVRPVCTGPYKMTDFKAGSTATWVKNKSYFKESPKGQPSIGTWLTLPDVVAARLMARLGFDWLTVELEHTPVNWETAANSFAIIAASGVVPLARVPWNTGENIKRVLDNGAFGIVVPMVNSRPEAEAVVEPEVAHV